MVREAELARVESTGVSVQPFPSSGLLRRVFFSCTRSRSLASSASKELDGSFEVLWLSIVKFWDRQGKKQDRKVQCKYFGLAKEHNTNHGGSAVRVFDTLHKCNFVR